MTAETPSETERARADLAAALEELEQKLNVPRRVKARVAQIRQERPIVFAGAAAAAALAVGTVAWLIVRPRHR